MSIGAEQPVLTTPAEEKLRARISQVYARQTDEQLIQQRVIQYAPLVRHIVSRIAANVGNAAEVEDLISAGTLGLVSASRRYDPSKQVDFKTYAYIRIRGAVIDELRRNSFVPSGMSKQIQRVKKTYRRMLAEQGHPPGDRELALAVGMKMSQLYKTFRDARKQHFLSIHGLDESKPSLGALAPIDTSVDPQAQAERKELLVRLTQAIRDLPKRDRLVVLLYYERDLTMKEIAHVLGITESRVSQLHAAAIFKLAMELKGQS